MKARPRSRLLRWTVRLLLAGLVLLVVARLALPYVLPRILESVARGYGLSATYESLDLSLLSGEVRLRRLSVGPRPVEGAGPARPYVQLEYAQVDLSVLALLKGEIRFARLEVDGLDLELERDADGSFALLEHFENGASTPPEAPEPEAWAAQDSLRFDLPFRVDGLRVQHVQVRLVDRHVDPPIDTWLEAHLRVTDLGHPEKPARVEVTAHGTDLVDRFVAIGTLETREGRLEAVMEIGLTRGSLEPLSPWLEAGGIGFLAGTLDFDSRLHAVLDPESGAELSLEGNVPGTLETFKVEASLVQAEEKRNLAARVVLAGLTLDRFKALLEEAGFEGHLSSGRFECGLEAEMRAGEDGGVLGDLRLQGLRFQDLDQDLLAVDRIALTGAGIHAERIGLESMEVEGVRFALRLDRQRALHLLGLKSLAGRPEPSQLVEVGGSEPLGPSGDPAPVGFPLPRIDLGLFRLRDTEISFFDESGPAGLERLVLGLEADLENLRVGGPAAGEANEARLRLLCRSEGLAEKLELAGTILVRPGNLDLEARLALSGEGLSNRRLGSVLEDFGLEPTLEAGRLAARLEARAQEREGRLEASLLLADVRLQEGEEPPLAGLAELRVEGISLGEEGSRVGRVLVSEPELRMGRDRDGALLAMGLRLPGTAAATDRAESASRPTQTPVEESARHEEGGLSVALERLELEGARLWWRDEALGGEPVMLVVRARGSLTDLALGRQDRPTSLAFEASIDEVLERATLAGSLGLDPADLAARLKLDLLGLRAGPLAAYLPEGMEARLVDGRAHMELAASVRPAEGGGLGFDMVLSDLEFRDGEQGEPWLGCEAIRAGAARFDPGGGEIDFYELTVSGLRLRARRGADRALELMGLAFAPREEAEGVKPLGSGAGEAAQAAPLERGATLPRVRVEKFDLELASLRFEDCSAGQAPLPLDGRLRLFAPGPLVLLDQDPEALAPIALRLEGAALPLVESIVVALSLAPWQPSARVEADLSVKGIYGEKITEVFPWLEGTLEDAGLESGSLECKLAAELHLRRRTPIDIDLSRGFGVDAHLRNLEFRSRPEGELLAGLQLVELQAPRIAPDGSVHISNLEVQGLTARVRRTSEGLEALGLRVKPGSDPNPAGGSDAPGAPADPGPEFRLDQLSVHGLDFLLEDLSVDPPMRVPLTGLDVQVSRFTTRAFTEPLPVRFSVSLTAGEVELPRRRAASSLVAGLLGSAAAVVTGRSDTPELEMRPMLDELAVNGRLSFFPELSGRVRTSIAGLELVNFRGAAREAGVDIGDGVLDGGIGLDFEGERGVRASANLTFDRLNLDEPADGPISRYLRLPAPLNTVLFALRDDLERIRIPLRFRVTGGSMGAGRIATAAMSALASVIADAVASAPLRVASTVTGAIGLGSLSGLTGIFGGREVPLEEQVVAVAFDPGSTGISPAGRESLASLAGLLGRNDQVGVVLAHGFGIEDLERAALLSSPSPAQAEALARGLRRRRGELAEIRVEAASAARVAIATGAEADATVAVERLQALDTEIGLLEDGLDRALDLLRPGAERRGERRARAMALELGNRRLEAVRAALLELGGAELTDRVEIRRARLGDEPGEAGGVTVVPRVRN